MTNISSRPAKCTNLRAFFRCGGDGGKKEWEMFHFHFAVELLIEFTHEYAPSSPHGIHSIGLLLVHSRRFGSYIYVYVLWALKRNIIRCRLAYTRSTGTVVNTAEKTFHNN